MKKKNKRRPKSRFIFLFSTIAISSALIMFILILINQMGYFNVISASDNPFIKKRIGILVSDYNFGYFKANLGSYDSIIGQFETTFRKLGISPIEIKDKALEESQKLDLDMIVLPSTVCLSDKQIKSVKNFVKEGGGLIMSWASGARKKDCSWRGWDFVEELSGSTVVKFEQNLPSSMAFITVNSESPVTKGMPSGIRLSIDRDESDIIVRSPRTDAFFSDWRLNPSITEKGYPPYAAIIHSDYGKGKVLWFTFHTTRLLDVDNLDFLSWIASNSIRWMLHFPQAKIDNWPYGFNSATIIDQDTEHQPENAANLIKVLKEEDVPATFFAISSLFDGKKDFFASLPKSLELASHLDTDKTLEKQSYEKQRSRINDSKKVLEENSGRKVLGLKPAEEIFDNNTLLVLMDLGFKYMIGNPNIPVAVPIVIRRGAVPSDIVKIRSLLFPLSGDFVLMPRIANDDFHIMVRQKIMDPEKILSLLKADFQNIENLSGLYILAVHTQLLSNDKYIQVARQMIKHAKESGSWIQSGLRIAEWWLLKNNLNIGVNSLTDDGFTVSVKSDNKKDDIENVSITVFTPVSPRKVDVRDSESKERMEFLYDSDSKSMKIRVPLLKAQEKKVFKVKLG